MKGVFRGVAFANLLPGTLVCLIAPAAFFRIVGAPLSHETVFFVRYLGVAYAALFLANAVAASRPSIWKPVVVLDLALFGGSALVPLSVGFQSGGVGWFFWANAGIDAGMFTLVAVAAVRTFWMD